MKFTGKKKTANLDNFKAKLNEKNVIGSMDKVLGGAAPPAPATSSGPTIGGKFSLEIDG